jgi:hypothetical protein
MEAPVLVESFRLWTLSFVKINNLPLLSSGSIVTPYLDRVSFFILTSSNIKNFSIVPVDKLIVLILEHLPPSRVCAPDLEVVCSS